MYVWSVPETCIPHNFEHGRIYRYNVQLLQLKENNIIRVCCCATFQCQVYKNIEYFTTMLL